MVYIIVSTVALLVVFLGFLVFIGKVFSPANVGVCEARKPNNEGEIISVNDFKIWFNDKCRKNDETIIVLHGGPGMSSLYFQDSLKFLEDHYNVIYFDQRGAGYSEVKPGKSLYKIKNLVEDLESLRKDVIKKDKVILLAHSAGCQLALRYAIKYEEYLNKLILVSSPSVKSNILEAIKYSLILLKKGLPPHDPYKANKWYVKALQSMFEKTLYNKANSKYLENLSPANFAVGCYTGNSTQNDISDKVKNLNVETLIIYGQNDLFYTNEIKQKYLHSILKNSCIEKFTQSGHWSFFEEPGKFKSVVNKFLLNNKINKGIK